MANKKEETINWKAITIILMSVIVVLSIAVLALALNTSEKQNSADNDTSSITIDDPADNNTHQDENVSAEPEVSSVDELMTNFSGSDEEVIQVCETELHNLGIDDYVSIDHPLEGKPFIQETRVGTYELNGILRTPSNSPDMPQPKSTEMLCTIFPGDEYPVEITFGKDW